MPIEVVCSSCNRRLRVPDKAAGKRIKCPQCQAVVSVPAVGPSESSKPARSKSSSSKSPSSKPAASNSNKSAPAPARPASSAPATSTPAPAPTGAAAPVDKWYLKTEDQSQYGPVPKAELDSWVAEGRLTARCQVLREGDPQWQWASDAYPQLAGQAAATEQADESETAASDNPFDFAAADTSPTARYGGRRRRSRGSGTHVASTSAALSPGQIVADIGARGAVKSKLTAGLLGLFLGGWGVHRFYLGYTGMGVLQIVVTLCTCVGAWWGIIEGIMILTGSFNRDAMGRPLRD